MTTLLKLLLIAAIVLFVMRPLFRLMYPKMPARRPELQAETAISYVSCEYCGLAVNEKQAVQVKGRYFCGSTHAQQF